MRTVKLKQYYPFIIWLLCISFIFYKYMIEVSPSIIADQLMREFSITGLGLGNLSASYFYVYVLIQIPVGILLDRFGIRVTSSCAILLCALGTLLFANSHSITFALIGRIVTGTGAAFAIVNCMKAMATWFAPKYFPILVALMMTLGILGEVFGQAPMAAIIATHSWRSAFHGVAIIGILLAVVFYLVVRNRPQQTRTITSPSTEQLPWLAGIKQVIIRRQAWLLAFYGGLAFAPIMAFAGLWGVQFVMHCYGLAKIQAAFATSLMFIGFAIGAPIGALLAYVIGNRYKPICLIGTLLGLSSASTVIFFPEYLSITVLHVGLFLTGFGLSFFLLSYTLIKENYPIRLSATATGFMNLFNAAIGALSEPLIGGLLDWMWNGKRVNGVPLYSVFDYQVGLSLVPLFLLIALILLFFIQETKSSSHEV